MKKHLPYFLLTFILILADQFTKHLAVLFLRGKEACVLIPGVLELFYLENNGAAFSMLRGRQWFFYSLTIIFLAFVLWFLHKMPDTDRLRPLRIAVLVMTAGAVGNFIDRLMHRYVVDFIYFSLIDFPVFNVADICVTLSVAVLIFLVLFYYKDSDLAFLSGSSGRPEKQEETGKTDVTAEEKKQVE